MWRPDKKKWCCKNKNLGCPPGISNNDSFNCLTRERWSPEKREWCCENKNLGCPRKSNPPCAIDCHRYGDSEARCVYGSHCLCSKGFVCEDTSLPGECSDSASCISPFAQRDSSEKILQKAIPNNLGDSNEIQLRNSQTNPENGLKLQHIENQATEPNSSKFFDFIPGSFFYPILAAALVCAVNIFAFAIGFSHKIPTFSSSCNSCCFTKQNKSKQSQLDDILMDVQYYDVIAAQE